jgi:hypothetical protein
MARAGAMLLSRKTRRKLTSFQSTGAAIVYTATAAIV